MLPEDLGGGPLAGDPELPSPDHAPAAAPEAAAPMISFSHVSIWFGERKILDNVSFTVNRGQTLCILGRSGVGKSVALRILMGFLHPQVGLIRVEGEEINGLAEEGMQAIRKRVTMVFQNGALFDSLSVRENVAFPLRERGGLAEDQIQQVVDRLIGLVGAEDVVDDLPASLSTGRKRAVAIARALVAQPEVVLYDEPPPWSTPSSPAAWETSSSVSSATGLHQHHRHPRYALRRAPRRPGAFSRSGASRIFWPVERIHGLSRTAYSAVPDARCLRIAHGLNRSVRRGIACCPSIPRPFRGGWEAVSHSFGLRS